MEISDEILVQHARQGVEHAFRQLVQRYNERIINVCFRIVGNDQDAEEAAMDTFLRVIKGLTVLKTVPFFDVALSDYSGVVPTNRLIDIRRKVNRLMTWRFPKTV